MADNDFLPLGPLLNNELRLAIMSILMSADSADFTYIKNTTKATSGNISVQIDKLEKAKYIKVKKGYKGKVPQTVCRITPQGIQALADHVQALKSYLNLNI